MPLYEYRCKKCGRLIEVIQGFKDAPLVKCESCGGRLEKQISRSGFVLKGSGWYQSDYKSAPKESKGDAAPSESASTSDASSATKPESTSPSKTEDGGSGTSVSKPSRKKKKP